jgi:hypothetical protein
LLELSCIAPGFGTVSVTLALVRRLTDAEERDWIPRLLVAGDPPTERRIAKAEVTQRTIRYRRCRRWD